MQVEALYQDIILDHYRSPHGKGLRDPFDAEVYHVNPTCGDEVTLRVRLSSGEGDGDGPVVEDVSYDCMGCSISQAAASVLHDLVQGRRVDDAMRVHDEFLALMQSKGQVEPDEEVLEDGVAFAGVSKYPARIKCALLAWMAWKDATLQAMGAGDAVGTHEQVASEQLGTQPDDERGAGR
ncbi:Fe-S cluster assembly sulfur transfer protein SufU [Actinopolymorpha sp. B9G3]|uniref:Fe-S cluster assembly sulfur transfer protein SufU n=1 Tax=Actinopolymorpha sp. B9G3 TaxID=3158970 RepID=UPI0032D93C80